MQSAKAVVSENLARHGTTGTSMSYGTMTAQRSHTVTFLKRWSILNKELPSASQIRAIHVYDFDNTCTLFPPLHIAPRAIYSCFALPVFRSPLPNPQLWTGPSIGFLQAVQNFTNGGWWHDPNILAATGKGIETEEPLGWNGWWNENILRLVQLSMEQKDALTVLLTGRNEARFAEIIKRMVTSQKLDFDLIGLKTDVGPNGQYYSSTMAFKQGFLEDIVLTYGQAEEIRVYEDRPKHVKGFRDFFEDMNLRFQSGAGSLTRNPIPAEVIQVAEENTYLDPVTETAEVQRMINSHNMAVQPDPAFGKGKARSDIFSIKRLVLFTGYLLSQSDSQSLIRDLLIPTLPEGISEASDMKYMANSIMIKPGPTPRPVLQPILNRIGGMGKRLSWQVTGLAAFENKVWAARVAPIPSTEAYYADKNQPLVVLAVRKHGRPGDATQIQNWLPVPADKALTFETVVDEKVVLRICNDTEHAGSQNDGFVYKGQKRRFQQGQDEDVVYPQSSANPGSDGFNQPPHPRQGVTTVNLTMMALAVVLSVVAAELAGVEECPLVEGEVGDVVAAMVLPIRGTNPWMTPVMEMKMHTTRKMATAPGPMRWTIEYAMHDAWLPIYLVRVASDMAWEGWTWR
ncbi:Protein of unknown function DUF2410 [Penicillium capsulatum]|uniref:Swiss Army Knife RNA repair protein HAD domain-containing protein n=1 Tax=Penicillium capsulatum TaxID=69766 RepID=A0A9W9I0V6_9EURO|nr:Protein of unknown function DUF2410 [Penicillium capsulatum]KAJ6116315.1 Protein of unknown function DUF2410 [Penicillium capsulatum]